MEKKRRCGARTNGDGDVRLRDLLFPQPSVQVRGDPDRSQRAALGEDVLRAEHRALGCRDARVGCHDLRWESATRRISRIPGTRGRARRSASRAFARTARALAERAGDAPSVRSRAERSGTRARASASALPRDLAFAKTTALCGLKSASSVLAFWPRLGFFDVELMRRFANSPKKSEHGRFAHARRAASRRRRSRSRRAAVDSVAEERVALSSLYGTFT